MIPQGSPEWIAVRLGKLTASNMADAMAKTKTGEAASRTNLITQLAVERITGVREAPYISPAMRWGMETEGLAKFAYSARTLQFVDDAGFIPHPRIQNFGASPDGFVGEDGLIEIKCPNSATHVGYLLNGNVPGNYRLQILVQLACCPERQWCDFVSFDPRMPAGADISIVRVLRNEDAIREVETEAIKFLSEVDRLESLLLEKCRSVSMSATSLSSLLSGS